MKFNGICLVTKNVRALTDYYCRVLGATAEGNDTHAEIRIKPAGLAIFSTEGMEGMAPGITKGSGSGSVTLMFEVENADLEYEQLKGLGVDIVKLPETYPWGTRSFWFRDPDGNIVDFYSEV